MVCFQKKNGCIKPKKSHPGHGEPKCSTENLTLAKKKELKGITNRILSEANQEIRETFPGLDISDAANLVPEFHLEKKKNKIEKQKLKRKIYKEVKENIESQWMETAVERYKNYSHVCVV